MQIKESDKQGDLKILRLSEKCLSSEFARLRESFTLKMHSRLPNVTEQMLLYLYVNLRLMNKLTSEMGNFVLIPCVTPTVMNLRKW